MKRTITWTLLLILSASLLPGLSACGKKGPLYIDKQEQAKP
jgi:predicted small lipoprotein YifL